MRAYARTAWRLASSGPGPWLIAASGIGWLLLFWRAVNMPHGMAMGPHAGHGAADWALMLLAMSPLVLRSEVEWLLRNSLRRNRTAAGALFGLGYAAPWLLVGAVWLALPGAPGEAAAATLAITGIALLAWHASPARQRLLNACHRRPSLRAFGLPMAADTARFGITTGATCSAVCGPAMLLSMDVPQWHLPAMALASAWLTVERYLAPRRPNWRRPWSFRDRAPRWRSYGFANSQTVPVR